MDVGLPHDPESLENESVPLFDAQTLLELLEAQSLSKGSGSDKTKAERIRQKIELGLKLDDNGNPKLLKLGIREGCSGFVSAGGWNTDQVMLPERIRGFCEDLSFGVNGPAISIAHPVVPLRGPRQLQPGNLVTIIPLFDENQQPVVSLVA